MSLLLTIRSAAEPDRLRSSSSATEPDCGGAVCDGGCGDVCVCGAGVCDGDDGDGEDGRACGARVCDGGRDSHGVGDGDGDLGAASNGDGRDVCASSAPGAVTSGAARTRRHRARKAISESPPIADPASSLS
jgi:hypothetical protein